MKHWLRENRGILVFLLCLGGLSSRSRSSRVGRFRH